jgi:hypothetical protein
MNAGSAFGASETCEVKSAATLLVAAESMREAGPGGATADEDARVGSLTRAQTKQAEPRIGPAPTACTPTRPMCEI